MSSPANQLAFHDGVQFFALADEFIDSLQTPVRLIGDAFVDNLERARRIGTALIAVAHHAAESEQRVAMARFFIGVRPDDDAQDHTPKFGASLETVSRDWVEKRLKLGNEGINKLVMEDGSTTIDHLVRAARTPEGKDSGPIPSGIQSILGAMLLMGYGGYEALISDLWVAALDHDPEIAATYLKAENDKTFKLADLAGHNFDLSRSMGTFLTRSGRVQLVSFESVVSAYKQAFGVEVDVHFQPRKELRLVEKIRHLLAHRGGVVDAKFVKEMTKHPEYASLGIDAELPLTGTLVQRHLNACI